MNGSRALKVYLSDSCYVLGHTKKAKFTNRLFNTKPELKYDHYADIPYASRNRMFDSPTKFDLSRDDSTTGNPINGTAQASPEWDYETKNPYSSDKSYPELDPTKVTQLSVYVPHQADEDARPDSKKKVYVIVHGGSLTLGARSVSDKTPPQLLTSFHFKENDTIVVSVEYSLGPLGSWFFGDEMGRKSPSDDLPQRFSNQMLHETILALLWVQEHIEKFGGDPNEVTLAGNSAGSTICHYVHLVLDKVWLEHYKFKSFPFKRLCLMGGVIHSFPPMHQAAAIAQQNRIVQACDLDPRSYSTEDLVKKGWLPIFETIGKIDSLGIIWTFVIDGILIKGDADFLLASFKKDSHPGIDVKVLMTLGRN